MQAAAQLVQQVNFNGMTPLGTSLDSKVRSVYRDVSLIAPGHQQHGLGICLCPGHTQPVQARRLVCGCCSRLLMSALA